MIASAIAPAGVPVLCVDTCFLLDILRDPTRPKNRAHEPHDGQVTQSWSINNLTQRLKAVDVNIDWREVYKDVAFKTQDQIRSSATPELVQIRRRNRYLKVILVFWLAVIPAGWALIEYMGLDWLALIVVICAVVQATRAGGRIFRNAGPSPTEGAKAEKQLKMDHYYYHCERNPAGFLQA